MTNFRHQNQPKYQDFLTKKLKKRKLLKNIVFIPIIIFSISTFSLLGHLIQAQQNSSQPVGAYLVLGGSIMREIYIAKVESLTPEIPVIISSGSDAPCVYYIFKNQQVPIDNVWIEGCARSTFTNFIYPISILKKWGVKKVEVITSETHLPRADLLAKILLNSKGIALQLTAIKEERGISGNNESTLKTIIDTTRSIGWAFISQFISPRCNSLMNLKDINWKKWNKAGFSCERRGNVKIPSN